jgi:ATP-dependent helicase/nuclease subunit B
MEAGRPHVLSVPAGCPFLPTLVDALVEGRLIAGFPTDPMALADATI